MTGTSLPDRTDRYRRTIRRRLRDLGGADGATMESNERLAATADGPVGEAAGDPSVGAAAAAASRDAETVARSAARATLAVEDAARTAAEVVIHLRRTTAAAVAAAATSTAEIAVQAASAVEAEAVTRALEVAASALAALQAIAAQLPHDADLAEAGRAAAEVASTVAADVVSQERSTAAAASMVSTAVALAAEAAALAAAVAAAGVDLAAGTAAAHGRTVAGSIAATRAASDVAADSSIRVADLAHGRVTPLAAELERAVSQDELTLHYQPMYSMQTGALIAVEALLRWQHPQRGLLAPSEFLDVAEGHRLMMPIGDWVLASAVTQAASWQQRLGGQAPQMWVNISCDQLGRQHLTGVLERVLSESGLAPGMLGLEVTERQLIRNVDHVSADLLELRELGVSLAVDDFGTGYASLDYLRRFTFDEIKIDRTFVSGLGRDRTDTAVTSSIIALGRSLDLVVVAEGVETQVQYDLLQRLGCPVSQGYLLARPGPPEVISGLLGPHPVPAPAAPGVRTDA